MVNHSPLKPLLSEEKIRSRVSDLGKQITRDLQGEQVVFVSVLKGSFIFTADLVRATKLPSEIEFVSASSYGARLQSSGKVEITQQVSRPLQGRHVIVIEDIVDSGLTLTAIRTQLASHEPASLRVATLLHKPSRSQKQHTLDYVGFVIDDVFVVGYGLDFNQRYRELPYIASLDHEQGELG